MNIRFKNNCLGYLFIFPCQKSALDTWQGKEENVLAAQQTLYYRANCAFAARNGKYTTEMEKN